MLTIDFEGFCAIRHDDGEVLCPIGHAEEHTPVLVVPTEGVLDVAKTEWKPDLVTSDLSGRQIGLWFLRGKKVTVGVVGDPPSWASKAALLSFPELHRGSTFEDGAHARNGGVIALGAGTLTATKLMDPIDVTKDGQAVSTAFQFCEVFQWAGELVIMEERAGHIRFLETEAPIKTRITNTSAEPGGLDHFHNYYKFMKLKEGDKQATLTFTPRPAEPQLRMLIRVGLNCIPPGGLPA